MGTEKATKSSAPRAHHYLPKFYLRGFGDGRDHVWVYEKGLPVRRANISKEAHQRDLYSFPEYGTGERNDSSERALSQLETLVGALLPRVREIAYIPTEEERSQLCWFVALLFMRVPDAFRANREAVVPAVAQLFLKAAQDVGTFEVFYREHCPAADTPREIEGYRQDILAGRINLTNTEPRLQLASMWESSRQAVEVIEPFNMQFVHSEDSEEFITTDSPVVTMQYLDGGRYRVGCGLTTEGVEVNVPLTRDLLLRLGARVEAGHSTTCDLGVRRFNRILMQCAALRAYGGCESKKVNIAFERHGCLYKRGRDIHVPMWDGEPIGT